MTAGDLLHHCNSFDRLPTLIALWNGLGVDTSAEWLALLGEHWSTCDNIAAHADDLLDGTPLADAIDDADLRLHLMSDGEREALTALPDEVTLWRGCYAFNKWGLSWSLDRATAERFPTLHRYRQPAQPLLVKARILKRDILALKLCRNEAEVIAWRGYGSSLKQVSTSYIR